MKEKVYMLDQSGEIRILLYSLLFAETRQFYEGILNLEIVKEWDHGNNSLGVVYKIGAAYLEILHRAVAPVVGDLRELLVKPQRT